MKTQISRSIFLTLLLFTTAANAGPGSCYDQKSAWQTIEALHPEIDFKWEKYGRYRNDRDHEAHSSRDNQQFVLSFYCLDGGPDYDGTCYTDWKYTFFVRMSDCVETSVIEL
jgi:hypothetical protein